MRASPNKKPWMTKVSRCGTVPYESENQPAKPSGDTASRRTRNAALSATFYIFTLMLMAGCTRDEAPQIRGLRIEPTQSALNEVLRSFDGQVFVLHLGAEERLVRLLIEDGRLHHCMASNDNVPMNYSTKSRCIEDEPLSGISVPIEPLDFASGLCMGGSTVDTLNRDVMLGVCVAPRDEVGGGGIERGQLFYIYRELTSGRIFTFEPAKAKPGNSPGVASRPADRRESATGAPVAIELETKPPAKSTDTVPAGTPATVLDTTADEATVNDDADEAQTSEPYDAAQAVQRDAKNRSSDSYEESAYDREQTRTVEQTDSNRGSPPAAEIKELPLRAEFSCASASGVSELKLCEDGELAKLEDGVREAIVIVMSESPSDQIKGMVEGSYLPWVVKRNSECGYDSDCLRSKSANYGKYLRSLVGR